VKDKEKEFRDRTRSPKWANASRCLSELKGDREVMDSQTQLTEHNTEVSTPVESTVEENVTGINAEAVSELEPVTDQAIANSIQESLQHQPTESTIEPTRERYSDLSTRLLKFWQEFSQSSQPFLVSLAWFLGALVTLRILVALISAVNSIPLLAPLFELIGAGYAVWFTNRYLLKHSTRQELSQKIRNFTGQTFERPSDSSLAISAANTDLAVDPSLAASDPAMLEE
jgi:hypothetical protein